MNRPRNPPGPLRPTSGGAGDASRESGSLHSPTVFADEPESAKVAQLDRMVDELLVADDGLSHLPALGDVIDDVYQIGGELGRGAMGIVFAAFDLHLQRTVAIKLVKAQAPRLRQHFLQEARAMANVSHANVVAIHAFGEHGTTPYFVMDLVNGQTAEGWLRASGHAPDIDTALGIVLDVCKGVSAIHAAGTVHRDLKPSNVLLDKNLHAQVADLGLAVRYVGMKPDQEMVGTLEYMAPELCADDRQPASPASDVYALGCLAYELLTGSLPFDSETAIGFLAQHQAAEPPRPSARRPGLPVAFDDVILRALAKRPEQRTASADLFRRALTQARASSLEPVRILVAEDDPDFREVLQLKLLREFPDADIVCVGDGRSLVDAFAECAASVVLIDLQMPHLDGVGVTTLLRARPDANTVPIIVMTASGGPQEWRLLASLGADRFLVKPVNLDDMVTSIRNALRSRASSPPAEGTGAVDDGPIRSRQP